MGGRASLSDRAAGWQRISLAERGRHRQVRPPMRIVLQRVSRAAVSIEGGAPHGIGRGYVLLLGVAHADSVADANWLATKIPTLRLFPDNEGKMNRTLVEVDGEVLIVSQFTLYGSLRKGTRPSFTEAAEPGLARALYEHFVRTLAPLLPHPVVTGEFGAHMDVELVNDGPVTLLLDTAGKHLASES
jgi:D-aminoacyl-tRNA deacylase